MTSPDAPPPSDLLDRPPVGATDIAAVEAALTGLLGTASDVVLLQAEAIVALEATARGLARPGLRALNVVTGPYGALFGRWMAAAGAQVSTLAVPHTRAVSAAQVSTALAAGRADLVAVVHAEAATGSANPLDEIAGVVAAHGALLVVDAVASVSAHPVTPDAWRADVVVVGGQKALAGPAGVSGLAVSERAWAALADNPSAPRESILSLLDLRDGWLAGGRVAVPGTPSSLETAALGQALRRVADEGLPAVIGRHRAAAAAARAGVWALGLAPFIASDDEAAAVVTTVAPPSVGVADLVARVRAAGGRITGAAPGPLAAQVFRINHTGRAADLAVLRAEIAALGTALGRPSAIALELASAAWFSALA